MGQRSQTYIRVYNEFTGNGEPAHYLIARYHQWNWGHYMVSRLRSFIELAQKEHKYFYDGEYVYRKIPEFLDFNPDIRSIISGTDIIEDSLLYSDAKTQEDLMDYIFNRQDNNDGQLYIDVTPDKIYYAFVEEGKSDIMDAEEYLNWDAVWKYEDNGKASRKTWEDEEDDQEVIDYTKDNLKFLKAAARIMTKEHLADFRNCDYSKQTKNYPSARLELQKLRREFEEYKKNIQTSREKITNDSL